MRFKDAIALDIYIMTEDEIKQSELDLKIPDTVYDDKTEVRLFYCIDSIGPYEHDDRMSRVYSGGQCFMVRGNFMDIDRQIN
jgi:hypothetical protein